eukprot:356283-Pelagomonas_calceolata.AAC.1
MPSLHTCPQEDPQRKEATQAHTTLLTHAVCTKKSMSKQIRPSEPWAHLTPKLNAHAPTHTMLGQQSVAFGNTRVIASFAALNSCRPPAQATNAMFRERNTVWTR